MFVSPNLLLSPNDQSNSVLNHFGSPHRPKGDEEARGATRAITERELREPLRTSPKRLRAAARKAFWYGYSSSGAGNGAAFGCVSAKMPSSSAQ